MSDQQLIDSNSTSRSSTPPPPPPPPPRLSQGAFAESNDLTMMSAVTNGDHNHPKNNTAVAKLSAQLKKQSESNVKYKNLLKLAKDRIQQQEESLQRLQEEKELLEERLKVEEKEAAGHIVLDETSDKNISDGGEGNIVRVCQCLKVPVGGGLEEIWSLLEFELMSNDMTDFSYQPPRRRKEWKRFDSESELSDFIRRDTGEPLVLPPYSLSPEQSARIQEEATQQISKITEEFRRFRVRSELARKQADAQIRDLQSNNVQRAAQQIDGRDLQQELERALFASGQAERLKAELAAQEAHWKEAYDMLLAENQALKSAGSEALLAAQWRQRYETCLKEKEELQTKVLHLNDRSEKANEDRYEAKYRDLKESFRLYRKKAKEIFEAQQQGETSGQASWSVGPQASSSADAKLSYLKNLMVNYLTANQTVRDHMEGAIATVLEFSPEEVAMVEKKKSETETWF